MSTVKLYSARGCPYAHRTRLVLEHKHVGFELFEIDLKNKPEWFTRQVSAYGKVPAIQHEDTHLYESSVINEYLDEVFPRPELLPAQPARRALARIWIDYANTRFTSAYHAVLRGPEGERAQARQTLTEVLTQLEEQAFPQLSASGTGPFFFGQTLSLVDFTFYPWFERWVTLEHYRDFALPQTFKRIHQWQRAVRELEAVRKQENPPEYYLERYASVVKPQA